MNQTKEKNLYITMLYMLLFQDTGCPSFNTNLENYENVPECLKWLEIL